MYGVAADAGVTPKINLADYTPDEIATVKKYIKTGLEDKYKPSITTNNAKLSREQTAKNQAEDNAIARASLKLSQEKVNQVSQTVVEEDLRDKYQELVLDKNNKPIKTTKVSTTTKTNPNSKAKETKAELKAKADALRKKYAPKK
jgi:hypothetical protein